MRRGRWSGIRRFGAGMMALLSCTICCATVAESATWTLLIPTGQPIRIQRSLTERTPDGGTTALVQIQQGVNPLAQLLVYIALQMAQNHFSRAQKADEVEIVVPTDAAMGAGAITLTDAGTQKRFETQDDVNRVIRPYAEALSGSGLKELLEPLAAELRARGVWLVGEAPADSPAVLQWAPRFVFAADQRSISVDMFIGRLPRAVPGDASTARTDQDGTALRVQVYSAAADAFDIGDHWLKDGASALRGTLAALLVKALDVALPRLSRREPESLAQQRTYRFRLGAESLFIRGTLLTATCEQLVLHSIEGAIVAAPAAALRDKHLLPSECPRG